MLMAFDRRVIFLYVFREDNWSEFQKPALPWCYGANKRICIRYRWITELNGQNKCCAWIEGVYVFVIKGIRQRGYACDVRGTFVLL